ncbi:hypothetical protein EDD17DRAFT_1764470 [Pisolithus thermaeus]|nr:hypothetical protein EDD17DRAFT_1764470 [Pisolithus thermaeus]
MFVKNSLALQDAVDHILTIFKTLIVNSGGLEEAEKLEQWRNAVRDIRQELESVRSIANRTDNILHLLIGMDKHICWMENLGMPGIPFPDWHHALFPPLESIASHPWLLTVERQYNAGLLVQPPAPATEAEASMLSTTPSRPRSTLTMSTVPCMAPKGSIGHILTRSTPLGKGKGIDPSEQKGAKVAMVEAVPIPLEDNNGDMSKVVEEDIEMDDIKPAHGRSQKRGRPTSKSQQPSRMLHSQSRMAQRVRKSVSSEGEANIVEATAVAGEAQPVVAAEGGIGSEHHQMTDENSGECPTEGEGATTILASEQQVGDVSAIISEEELGSAGGKLAEG